MAIWDMSTPPASPLREDAPKDDTLRYVGTICSQSRLCTVRLDGITGLTFFMRNGHLVHIHRHTLKAPQARQPSSVTPHDSYDPTCWRYVPLSEADHIEAIKVDETNTGAFQITVCLYPCTSIPTRLLQARAAC